MGYCTDYSLTIYNDDQTANYSKLNDIMQYYCDDAGVSLCFNGEAHKWYTHEADLLKMSIAYPFAVFALHGNGEESGDLWVKYFRNGEMQVFRQERWTPPKPKGWKLPSNNIDGSNIPRSKPTAKDIALSKLSDEDKKALGLA